MLINPTVGFVNGWANFSDLSISHDGSDYYIDFAVSIQSRFSYFRLKFDEVTELVELWIDIFASWGSQSHHIDFILSSVFIFQGS